jgi:hypothetical protein
VMKSNWNARTMAENNVMDAPSSYPSIFVAAAKARAEQTNE